MFLMLQLEDEHFASKPFVLTDEKVFFEDEYMINSNSNMAINLH